MNEIPQNGRNRLSGETSPYLLQHKDNPVWWHSWGDEAFQHAAAEDKPIFLSIGYSTCYWCHVMEHDSFESAEVAAVLNQKFIAIKVDREERPDVDQVYMDAVVALTGHGGWPMSVFLTPDRKPFWGGTFFPKAQFLKILDALSNAWQNDRQKVLSASDHVLSVLTARAELSSDGPQEPDAAHPLALAAGDELLRGAVAHAHESYDAELGGFSPAPKFPPATLVSLLLRVGERFSDAEVRSRVAGMALHTLRKMAQGGLFDQLGGGFHRYSTDAEWLVPHFEKMLYDNALLAQTYLEASQVSSDSFFAGVARDTLQYLLTDMQSEEGGFFAAEDAGDVGKEGEFYVWNPAELTECLGTDGLGAFSAVHPVSPSGNFEHGTTILTLSASQPWSVKDESWYRTSKAKLLAARAQRKRPLRDDKIICGWNGLAVSAFAKGFQVLRDPKFLQAAQKAAARVLSVLRPNGKLLRSYCQGEARHCACLEDYAYLIEGLLALYRADLDEKWKTAALELQKEQDEALWDKNGTGYFFSAASDVPVNKKDYLDNATPSSSATSYVNLTTLHVLFHEPLFERRAQELLSSMLSIARRHPSAVSKLLTGIDMLGRGLREVKLISSDFAAESFLTFAQTEFLPHVILVGDQRSPGGTSSIQICEGQTCLPETTDGEAVREQLRKVRAL